MIRPCAEFLNPSSSWTRGLINKLTGVEPAKLAFILGHIRVANGSKITNIQFKKASTMVPSFSKAPWIIFAQTFGLSENTEKVKLEEFHTPLYLLSTSPSSNQHGIHLTYIGRGCNNKERRQHSGFWTQYASGSESMAPLARFSQLAYVESCPSFGSISRPSN